MSNPEPAFSELSPAGASQNDPSVLLGFEPETPEPAPVVREDEPRAKVLPTAAAPDRQIPAIEPVAALGQSAQARPEPASAVSLAQLQSRDLPIRWYEAVAIVQGLCRALVEARQETMAVALDTVLIRAEGHIYVARAELRDGAAAVNAVGRILDAIAGVDLPAPLKFATSKATSTPPVYASVDEFSRTLAYFERPNGVQLLQGVYERWKSLPPLAAAVQPIAPIAKAEPVERKVDKPSPRPSRNRRLVPAAIVALTLCGISLWAFSLRSPKDTDRVSETAASAGADPTVETPSLVETASSTDVPHPVVTARGRGAPRRGREASIRLPEIRLPEQPAPGRAPAPRSSGNQTAVLAPSPAVSDEVSGQSVADVADAFTYSAADPNVISPVAVYPKLPTLGPADDGVAAFEIVVSESGTVESVKASDAPESIGQAMQMTNILSAAKSWLFRPASKDGHSVRYRLLVWLQIH